MVSGRSAKRDRRSAVGHLETAEVLARAKALLNERTRGFRGGLDELAAEVPLDAMRLLRILDSRALKRAGHHSELATLLSPFGWRCGFAISAADQILQRLDAPWFSSDCGSTEDERWLAELRGGLDTFARICWCLRFGYTLAAAALTRRYIERWTYNLGHSNNVRRAEGESDEEYIDRTWDLLAWLIGDRSVSADWSALSEMLHGRPACIGSVSVRTHSAMPPIDRAKIHNFIIRAAEIPLRHVRGSIGRAAFEKGLTDPDIHAAAQRPVASFPPSELPPDFLQAFFRPLDYAFVTSSDASTYSSWGETYRRITETRSMAPIDVLPFDAWMAIEERWARTIDESRSAFASEQLALGKEFRPETIAATLLQYRSIAEMTDLVADALANDDQKKALQAAAAALESAWVLWLQDVDDSLACIRTTLEATARARVHRLKPNRAAALELQGRRTSPNRWVEAAGWGRLSPFVRALGEFSHIQERSRHTASRALLTDVQRNPIAGGEIHTARARALEETAMMLGHEVAASLQGINPDLAKSFRSIVLDETETDSERNLSEWLDKVLRFRAHDFGAPEFGFRNDD